MKRKSILLGIVFSLFVGLHTPIQAGVCSSTEKRQLPTSVEECYDKPLSWFVDRHQFLIAKLVISKKILLPGYRKEFAKELAAVGVGEEIWEKIEKKELDSELDGFIRKMRMKVTMSSKPNTIINQELAAKPLRWFFHPENAPKLKECLGEAAMDEMLVGWNDKVIQQFGSLPNKPLIYRLELHYVPKCLDEQRMHELETPRSRAGSVIMALIDLPKNGSGTSIGSPRSPRSIPTPRSLKPISARDLDE